MKPYFSIVIPYHNSSKTIDRLLSSISQSKAAPLLEVIVVDDCSKDTFLVPRSWILGRKYKELGAKNSYLRPKTYTLRTIRLQANLGPAAARNRGAQAAKGKFLVFLDSDVELLPDALHNLWQIYKEDPDIVAVTGVWLKDQKTKKFFPNFKALRDWSYWIHERDKSGYYYLFSTRIASIKRTVFTRLKGFDETYTSPTVEDIEFTYRVARRYAIIFAPNVRVRHEFEDFFPIAKKYFWRSYHWTRLYQDRQRFDPVATTLQEAVTALTGMAVFCAVLVLWLVLFESPVLSPLFPGLSTVVYIWFIITVGLALVHLIFVRKFLLFVQGERGWVFAVQSYIVGIILYCIIASGALWGRISYKTDHPYV